MKKQLVFLGILSLIPLLWFQGASIFVGHDNVFPLFPQEFLMNRLSTWSEYHGFGFDQSADVGGVMIHTIDAVPSLLGFSLQTTQKMVYVFWTVALLFSAYFFILVCEQLGYVTGKYQRYFLPVLYTFNFYTLQAWWIGERTKFSLMVAAPIILAIFLLMLRKKLRILTAAFLSATVLTVFNGGGWKGLPLYGGLFILFGVFAVYFSVNAKDHFASLKRITMYSVSFALLFLLFNLYSILPFLSHTFQRYTAEVTQPGGTENVMNWVNMISRDASIINLLRLQGIPDWYTDPTHPYGQIVINHPLMIVASFLFPILLIGSFFTIKKSKEKRLYGGMAIVLLISLILSSGSHYPFGSLYEFLVRLVPGFAIFRSPLYKFGYAFWFSYSFFIAITINWLIVIIRKRIGVHGLITAGLFTIFILVYHFPFLTGNFFSWSQGRLSTRVEIPQHVFDVSQWARENVSDERILMLPPANNYWKSDVYTWDYYSLFPLMTNASTERFFQNSDSIPAELLPHIQSLYRSILERNENKIRQLSQLLRVKYMIVRNDFDHEIGWSPTIPPKLYTEMLADVDSIKKIQSFGPWDVYELPDSVSSHTIRASSTVSLINDPVLLSLIPQESDSELLPALSIEDYHSMNIPLSVKSEWHRFPCVNCVSTQSDSDTSVRTFSVSVPAGEYTIAVSNPFDDLRGYSLQVGSRSLLSPQLVEPGIYRYERHSFSGDETVTLHLPLAESVEKFKEIPLRSVLKDFRCFGLTVTDTDERKKWPFEIEAVNRDFDTIEFLYSPYYGEFSNEVLAQANHRYDIKRNSEGEAISGIFEPIDRLHRAFFAFCGDGLTQEGLQKTITKWRLYEVTFPELYLQKKYETETVPADPVIEQTKINTAKYTVKVSNAEKPYVLILDEHYDEDWKLFPDGSSKHIRINGYANGWIIEGPSVKQFTIEYYPQRLLFIGSILSGTGFILSTAGIVWYESRKRSASYDKQKNSI